ncbi:selenium-binding protein [Carbonactinospora thermoautotrophica]|uniref:Methanethiol oxidase n=1 Tax=Carbonactinospora thermoautotrophica TaxID=1469144 RepID=A0A132N3H5_9ACTN|nr:selenium-binding family protein [Carbonactinospora thermoautotrophica]KWX04698.1 selenium-binding protein [Carbonactinospora thermoautotrophica]KWX08546.1 selenium-binding protein [Carbonactinospora thermoautotrophica]
MAVWKPDPTFYPSPRDAVSAPPEKLAYVAAFDRAGTRPDAIAVVDTDPESGDYGRVVGWTELPHLGDELHHFGWNACSSALCPYAPHPHVERRYLIVPGLRSSRIYVLDTKDDPKAPRVVKVLEPEELGKRAGYSRPHTVHCGPEGIYLSALGGADGEDGPGGVALLDHTSFEVLGRWEVDRGPQYLAYDFWWHLGHDTLVTSEWGTPSMIEDGLNGELLLGRQYGHRLHFWDLRRRRHLQAVDLGDRYQMPLELRPAHDPTKAYGFVGVVVDVETLAASVWVWHRDGEQWAVTKVIEIPAEPATADDLPPLLRPFGAVPPLVTDIDLSVDDRFLYVSCWGTGELRQYDVSDPFNPRLTGSVRLGGVVRRAAHPAAPDVRLAGGPQMVEVSRDGRRVYVTNSLYGSWDDQFYPDGVGAWLAKLDVDPSQGGLRLDERFFPHGEEFRGRRVHQTRLQGGDASSDSYCYP